MVKTIPYWKLGGVSIYPHLEFDKLYSYEELITIVEELKLFYKDEMSILVFGESSYCSEVNGTWNVAFGVVGSDGVTYMYMIRRDKDIGKSYACPFQNTEYANDINHSVLDGQSKRCPKEFAMIDKYFREKLEGKHINAFPTEKEETPSGFGPNSVFNYDPDNGDRSPTCVKIPHSGWSHTLG